MKIKMKAVDPDKIDVVLTVAMPLAAWKLIRAELLDSDIYPSREFRKAITEVVNEFEQIVEKQMEHE